MYGLKQHFFISKCKKMGFIENFYEKNLVSPNIYKSLI